MPGLFRVSFGARELCPGRERRRAGGGGGVRDRSGRVGSSGLETSTARQPPRRHSGGHANRILADAEGGGERQIRSYKLGKYSGKKIAQRHNR
jgi:hypothetical protein